MKKLSNITIYAIKFMIKKYYNKAINYIHFKVLKIFSRLLLEKLKLSIKLLKKKKKERNKLN